MRRERNYGKRNLDVRNNNKTIIIVCEGEKTENLYFDRYRQITDGLKIKIPKQKRTDPINLVNYAKKIINDPSIVKIPTLDMNAGDRVWCLFDSDRNKDEQIQEAKREADKHNINLGFSNPCFELWYLLHKKDHQSAFATSKKAEVELTKELPHYSKEKCFFDALYPLQSTAVTRAKRLNQIHIERGNPLLSTKSNPSTQIFELVEYIENNRMK